MYFTQPLSYLQYILEIFYQNVNVQTALLSSRFLAPGRHYSFLDVHVSFWIMSNHPGWRNSRSFFRH